MQTRALDTLTRIHQVQSFSRAAELQNMTLSALSMQMRSLETELGVALFDRSFRPPRLTPLGQQIAAQATHVLAEQDKLLALCGPSDRLRGQFRLGFIQTASVRLLPQFLKAVADTAPDARIEIETGLSETLSDQVAAGQLDGAVITGTEDTALRLHTTRLATEELALALPKSATAGQLIDDLTFVHFNPSTGIGKLIARYLGDQPAPPAKVMVLDGIEACIECVRAGLGYTILPRPDLDRAGPNEIQIKSVPGPQLSRDLVFISRDDDLTAKWRPRMTQMLRDAIDQRSAP